MTERKRRDRKRERVDYEIRRATLRDIDVLTEQRRNMFEEIKHRTAAEHRLGDKAYRAWVKGMMKQKRFAGFLAQRKDTGEIIGGGCVWIRENQPRPGSLSLHIPYLLSMYTSPEYRGHGVAARVVKEGMSWAKKQGFNTMVLHASPMGRSIYKRIGFERTWEMRGDL